MSFQNQGGTPGYDSRDDSAPSHMEGMGSTDAGTTPGAGLIGDLPNPKIEEIKKMLNHTSDNQKLEAMKRLIAMISKGRNVSSLFPQVVKCVICPDVAVKQLVYMYLIHYAEFEQDAALLSINHFQKDLENHNPLIRAQALRVMSAFRLPVIVRILVLSVQKCVTDNSPYVRKTAAHAIPKIFGLDHSVKDELIDSVETLLGDNTTLVLGSAIAAFSEICPNRLDLIHPHYRKFCNMLADMDEWGQIYALNMLTRYCRTQFEDPNYVAPKDGSAEPKKKRKKTSFYSDDEEEDEEDDVYDEYSAGEVDTDHRLLLRAANPLLQSRNSGVVLAVAMLYFYCAPKPEAQKVGKALIRLCREEYEIQYVVLTNISAMADTRPDMFSAYITEFFVYDSDPSFVRTKKLEIVTKIVTESSIGRALREFNHYVHKEDKEFVAATIQAIGRCAIRLPDVQESCLHGLMALLSNKSETVVAESVVVIKTLLQLGGNDDYVVAHLAKLLDRIQIGAARASIVWVVGEYCEKIPMLAPDILRVLAKTFPKEEVCVKLQIINLGAKLLLRKPEEVVGLLFQYICALAKYDTNYDVRDRARAFRTVLVGSSTPTLRQHALKIFCAPKPAPTETSGIEDNHFALNSLSHVLGHTAFGYQPVPEWAVEMADPSTRNQVARKQRRDYLGMGSNTGGYTPGAYSTARDGDDEEDFYSSDGSGFYSDDSQYDSEYDDSEYSDSEEESPPPRKAKGRARGAAQKKSARRRDFYSDEDDDDDDDEPAQDNRDFFAVAAAPASDPFAAAAAAAPVDPFAAMGATTAAAAPVDPFAAMGLTAAPPATAADPFAAMMGGGGGTKAASTSAVQSVGTDLLNMDLSSSAGNLSLSSMSLEPQREKRTLLKQVVGLGLEVQYQYLRRHSLYGVEYNAVQVWLVNGTQRPIQGVRLDTAKVESGADVRPFEDVDSLMPGTYETQMSVKFASSTSPVHFEVVHSTGRFPVQLTPPAGELIHANPMDATQFEALASRLGGMQEASANITISDVSKIAQLVIDEANVAVVTSDASAGVFQFAGKTIIGNEDLLISVKVTDASSGKAKCRVNCGNAIFANTLLSSIKPHLSN